jgi:hypothetical protein
LTKKIEICLETSRENLEEQKVAASSNEEFSIQKTESVSALPGSPIASSHFVDPIVGTILTSAGYIAKRIFDNWQKDKQQGIQIDLRKTPAKISRIAGTPAGFLLVIDAKGKVKTQQLKLKKKSGFTQYISKILG